MPIQYVSGDLFVNRFNAKALAQGCNCKGSMGAGIAVSFKEHYPAMYEDTAVAVKPLRANSIRVMYFFGKKRANPGYSTLLLRNTIGVRVLLMRTSKTAYRI